MSLICMSRALRVLLLSMRKKRRDALHVIELETCSLDTVLFTYADPWKGSGRCFPEVLIWIYGNLIDFQSGSMIFVVKLTEHHNALGALVAGEDMEIEQYHLAGEVREAANLSLVVLQGNFYASVYAHLACFNLLLCTLPVDDTDILPCPRWRCCAGSCHALRLDSKYPSL